jgi:hypothetical protein
MQKIIGNFNNLLSRQQAIQCELMGCRVRMCKMVDCRYRNTCEITSIQEKEDPILAPSQPEIGFQNVE